MMRTVAFLTFPLVLTAWAYAGQLSTVASAAEWGAWPSIGRFAATAELILAQADEGRTRVEPEHRVVVIGDEAKQKVLAELQGKQDRADPEGALGGAPAAARVGAHAPEPAGPAERPRARQHGHGGGADRPGGAPARRQRGSPLPERLPGEGQELAEADRDGALSGPRTAYHRG